MEQPSLSKNSHAVLLLASHLGSAGDGANRDSGLGPAGWQDFTTRIEESTLESPGDLLQQDSEEWPDDIWTAQTSQDWVEERFSRSTKLAMELEDLNNRGIWVTTIYEAEYPEKLYNTLERKAPPFFYVAGDAENLRKPAIGFVGSRDANESDKEYTRTLVKKALDDEFGIVSGGAKGIDVTSEDTGIEYGGPVIEFPVEGLQRCLKEKKIREAVMNGNLTLASHYHPNASWSMGGAMGRNKLIHGFADYTVVVRSGHQTGGTWEGATENLDNQWSTLLVCSHDETPAGNQALIERGAIPIDPTALDNESSFTQWLQEQQKQNPENDQSLDESTEDTTKGNSDNSDSRQSSLDQFD